MNVHTSRGFKSNKFRFIGLISGTKAQSTDLQNSFDMVKSSRKQQARRAIPRNITKALGRFSSPITGTPGCHDGLSWSRKPVDSEAVKQSRLLQGQTTSQSQSSKAPLLPLLRQRIRDPNGNCSRFCDHIAGIPASADRRPST